MMLRYTVRPAFQAINTGFESGDIQTPEGWTLVSATTDLATRQLSRIFGPEKVTISITVVIDGIRLSGARVKAHVPYHKALSEPQHRSTQATGSDWGLSIDPAKLDKVLQAVVNKTEKYMSSLHVIRERERAEKDRRQQLHETWGINPNAISSLTFMDDGFVEVRLKIGEKDVEALFESLRSPDDGKSS